MKKATCYFIAITTTLALFLFTGCSKQKRQMGPMKVPVQVKEVASADVPICIDSFGTLTASQDVDIKPRVTGQIKQILFKDGSTVAKDQLLVTLDTEQINAKVINDKAKVEQAKADYELKKFIMEKNRPLSPGSVSKLDFEKMKTDVTVAAADVQTANANLLTDMITMNYCSIRSPIEGIVGMNQIDIGNVVGPTDLLANVKNTDILYVDFTVPERNIDRIKKALAEGDLSLTVSVSNLTNEGKSERAQFPGTLSFITNESDPTTGTISLRATVPNAEHKLIPGQFVNVRLVVGIKKNAILVPKDALMIGAIGSYIYLVGPDNKAKLVLVEVYNMYKDYYVIDKGDVTPGMKAVVTGLLNVNNGADLQIKSDSDAVESKAKPEEKAKK